MRVNNRWVRKLLIVRFCGNSMSFNLVEVGSGTDISDELSTSILRVEVGLTKCPVYVNGPRLVPRSAPTLLYLTDSLPV
jgi:hypothetical protein